ncbi:MAG: lipoate--protein ligase family protein [bacterium]
MFRVIDTGLNDFSYNICMDKSLVELRKEGVIEDTFRFLRFKPCVLAGYHQSIFSEIRRNYCEDNGIGIGRRITGGGAIYFDETQLGWELVFSSKSIKINSLENLTESICKAFAMGIGKLGINARFRPRNDIEVEGRKISGTGGTYESSVYFFQGTLLLDFNPENMVKSLKIPVEKLTSKNFDSILSRVTSVKNILGHIPELSIIKSAVLSGFKEYLNIDFYEGGLSKEEEKFLKENRPHFASKDWVYLNEFDPVETKTVSEIYKCGGGLFKTYAKIDQKRSLLKYIYFTGDYFVSPARTINDLESYLRDTALDELIFKIDDYFEKFKPEFQNIQKEDFFNIIIQIINKVNFSKNTGIREEDLSRFIFVNGMKPEDVSAAEYILLPYCAKKTGCEYRNKDKCISCGDCETGIAYKFAERYGITPKTIISYENLVETLNELKSKNIKSYIGFCCKEFYIKRNAAFKESGIKALLIDISSSLCYKYKKEDDAYGGVFNGETSLGVNILFKMFK